MEQAAGARLQLRMSCGWLSACTARQWPVLLTDKVA